MDLDFLLRVRKGDPHLSAGLVKIGDPIYLAKWETNEPQPTLLHIQSISDVELFGIDTSNYARFVLEREEWQRRFPFNADSLRRDELAQVTPPGAGPGPRAPPADPPPVSPSRPAPPPTPQLTPRPVATASPLSVIPAPRPFPEFPCLAANPSCGRDPWWVEWNQLTRTDPVTYEFAPGLATEAKYIEVIWLLWLWPEGRALIQEAAANGVTILTMRTGTLPRLTVAIYVPSLNAVGINPSHNEVSTWMLASTVVHELKHASDDWNGLFTERTRANCVTREQRAFAVERRYAQWISAWQGGFPSETQVALRLSSDDFQAFMNIMSVVRAPDLDAYVDELYRTRCAA